MQIGVKQSGNLSEQLLPHCMAVRPGHWEINLAGKNRNETVEMVDANKED